MQGCFVETIKTIRISQDFWIEWEFFLQCVWMGVRFTLFYEGMLKIRTWFEHSRVMCIFENISYIFFVVYAFENFLLKEHSGAVRWYVILGIVLGWGIIELIFLIFGTIYRKIKQKIS